MRQWGQSRAKALSVATSRQRICGKDGVGDGSGLVVVFFPKPQRLEKGKGDHRHERMMVQAPLAAALEIIEADLLLHLLVHLLADPAALDQRRQALQRDILRMVAQVVFALA